MKPNERQNHWDWIYSKNSPNEVSWFQQEPDTSVQLIKDTEVDFTAPIIDIGGGASVLADRLMNAGYTNLSVLDISAKSLDHAKQQLGRCSEKISWITADITKFTPPKQYLVWHDRAVFHFLTEKPDRRAYIQAVKDALPVGGHVIIAAFAIGGPTKCSGLAIVQYDSKKLLAEFDDSFSMVGETLETHKTPGGVQQSFSYFRLLKTK